MPFFCCGHDTGGPLLAIRTTMRKRILDYMGYGLGLFLITHKDPPPAPTKRLRLRPSLCPRLHG